MERPETTEPTSADEQAMMLGLMDDEARMPMPYSAVKAQFKRFSCREI